MLTRVAVRGAASSSAVGTRFGAVVRQAAQTSRITARRATVARGIRFQSPRGQDGTRFMRNGFSVGRIFGIRITIDWSWIFIFVLVIWNVGTAVGDLHPSWSLTTIWAVAVVAAILFFASVLAHELAHSLVARAQGLPVRTITLFLFGGVSNIQREPHSPGAEFLMAIVGPFTSIVLGVIFLVLGDLSSGTP